MKDPDSIAVIRRAVAEGLQRLEAGQGQCAVAYSGGLDSTVLLHAVAAQLGPERLQALHVNHGLHPDAGAWAEHCRRFTAVLGLRCQLLTAQVQRTPGTSLEAVAREARYGALFAALVPGETLLLAHHRRDQAESFLLAALRGGGLQGLAGMPVSVRRNGHRLLRPLLQVSRDDLQRYAEHFRLVWVEDPSNADTRFDRNFLRREVLPVLKQRWPAAELTLSRSAALSADASTLLQELADHDIGAGLHGNCLDVGSWLNLTPGRQKNALRRVIGRLALPLPSTLQLEEARRALLESAPDAAPLAAWPGARVRRYRSRLWFFTAVDDPGACPGDTRVLAWDPVQSPVLELGSFRGRLRLSRTAMSLWSASDVGMPKLTVRFRCGGEHLRPAAGGSQRSLKKLLQEAGVVPWMRSHIPLLYLDEELAAVADLWVNADCIDPCAAALDQVVWDQHTAIR